MPRLIALLAAFAASAFLPASPAVRAAEFAGPPRGLGAAVVPPAVSERPPGELANRSLELARREVAALRVKLKPWDKDPRATLMTAGGHTEHHVRPNTQPMIAFAVVARFSPDPAERARALADLVAMLRFVAPTHSAGPLTCATGKKWRDQWQSALWAQQAGLAAWLVWDRIQDPALKDLVANMVAVEADRFVGQEPPHQIKRDTKAEENAWNATVVSLAANMLPADARAPKWRHAAIRWQLSSFIRPADLKSDRVVDGRPLKDWGFAGANVHDDYSLENHDRVHPSYMGTIGINLAQHLHYRWGKAKSPEALDFNAVPIYALLKRFSHPDGRMHFPNGQDWELHRVSPGLHGVMAALFNDPEAAYLERASLETCEKMQARRPGGPSLLDHEYFFPSLPGMYAAAYAQAFLFSLEYGDGPAPVSAEQFLASQCGVWNLAEGQFVFHRTRAGFVSFSWGARVMGQAIPFGKDLLGSPYELGFVGSVLAENEKKEATPKVADVRVTPADDGFVASARLLRAGGAVEQQVAFVSLPGGAVVYLERLAVLKDVALARLRTGTIGVLNEPEWVYQGGPRKLAWEGGSAEVDGTRPMEPLRYRSPWLNVDGRWGFAWVGAGGFVYEPNTRVERGRREQLLSLAGPEARAYKAGEVIATRGLVVLLGADVKATAAPVWPGAELLPERIGLTVAGRRVTARFGTGAPDVRVETP